MTHMNIRSLAFLVAVVASVSPTFAQSTIVSATDKFSWSENGGWMNWRDAASPLGNQGALFLASIASGFVWCENVGWINLGDGSPANGVAYTNSSGIDFGVNVAAGTGHLSGFAWGENAGWINFAGGALAAPPNPARLDADAGRLRGYAWGENVGWINLDDSTHFVGLDFCACDFNMNGTLNSQDFFDFIAAFLSSLPAADFNNDAEVGSQDFFDFSTCFFAGC